jgi:MtaA/CmuA family methyltransferase
MNNRARILVLLEGGQVDSLPVMPITMMFAADYVGVKYREYATNFRVQAEAQIRVAEDFDFDYVSVISDPACEAADCGASVSFGPDQPPAIDEAQALLADKGTLAALNVPDPLDGARMRNRVKAVALLKERAGAERLVEGWIEGPVAEGADLRGINTLMLDFYDDRVFVRDLFDFVVEMGLAFAKAQVKAGADLIGIGDAAASLIGPSMYSELAFPFERKLVQGIHALGARVRLHICGDTRHILEGMGRLGCEIVDLDFLSPVSVGRSKMGPRQVLLGNIDPVRVLRNGTPETVYEMIAKCHRQAGPRYIVGAGCEVPRHTPRANVQAMVRYAREHRPA